jgi:hypothetical protein
MGMFKTLKELQEKTARQTFSGDGVGRFLTVKDGEEYRIRFRQELTEDSAKFDEEIGTAYLVQVHTNPGDFKKNARCTAEIEDYNHQCWACEQIPNDNGWRAKNHLLINVAVFNAEDEKWEPKILDQKFTSAHVANSLLEYAGEFGTIVDKDYKIKRTGTKQQTQYTLIPLAEKAADKSIKDLTMHDLSKTYRVIAPQEQAGFYLSSEDNSGSSGWE